METLLNNIFFFPLSSLKPLEYSYAGRETDAFGMSRTLILFSIGTIFFILVALVLVGEPFRNLVFFKGDTTQATAVFKTLDIALNKDIQPFKTWLLDHFPSNQHQNPFLVVVNYYYWIYSHWVYQADPNIEIFQSPWDTVRRNFQGDCDDYSIIMAKGLKEFGYRTRIVFTQEHAFPEVWWKDQPERILGEIQALYKGHRVVLNILKENEGYWIPLDYVAPYPGALPMMNHAILYQIEL